MTAPYHIPVLADEVIHYLQPVPGAIHIDGTLGGGGHAQLIGERLVPGGTLVVIDRDPSALQEAQSRLAILSVNLISIHGNFRDIPRLLTERNISMVDGVLLDIGVSSHMFDVPERGFSFRTDAPLDMRMDPTTGETAAELIARSDEKELCRIFTEYGEERWAVRVARFLVDRRSREPIESTAQLVDVVMGAIPKGAQSKDIHPATRIFQALRIAVNDELGALQDALNGAVAMLAPGGRLAVVSYHSLEDRIVKRSFVRYSGRCECPPGLPMCFCGAKQIIKIITKKPVIPCDEEIRQNPRARSARLRVVEKLPETGGER